MMKRLYTLIIVLATSLFLPVRSQALVGDPVSITIHLRGVHQSKISLLALNKSQLFKPIEEIPVVMNGETVRFSVAPEHLPGEFVIRFDYKELSGSTPYPAEKSLLVGHQDLELWVSPKFCNNSDSTWFQPNESENATLNRFMTRSREMTAQLGLLQNLLMNYDAPGTDFYQRAVTEYNARRTRFHKWVDSCSMADQHLFVSNLYNFEKIPAIRFTGNETDRLNNLIDHYFDEMSFAKPLLIRTQKLYQYMNNYINLTGQKCTTEALRDSLIPAAARVAVEKAKRGHPQVYGWMVDYFYRGFEANGIGAGMKVLEPYINDPACLTAKRYEIQRRLDGMRTLTAGIQAPDIELPDSEGKPFKLSSFKNGKPFNLIVFWSADCAHCLETIALLHPWSTEPARQEALNVIAVSLDETDTEIEKWISKIPSLTTWRHLRAAEGVRSKVASDYFILATPVMVLVDASTGKILAMPDTPAALKKEMEQRTKR